jgi:hypothetical protein
VTIVKFDVTKFPYRSWHAPKKRTAGRSLAGNYKRLTEKLLTNNPFHTGNDYICPIHDDRHPSLGVTLKPDRILVYCSAGCATEDLVTWAGMTMADLFGGRPKIKATYGYVDEDSHLLFQVVRYEPKQFRQRRPDGNGGWVWRLDDVRRVLYHLPKLMAAIPEGRTIFVPEGEEDVRAIEGAGGVATTNPGGAGKWREEYTQTLKGASEVIIIADQDDVGARHAMEVAASLAKAGIKNQIVAPKEGKDAADHLAAGHGLGDWLPFTPPEGDFDPEREKKIADLVEQLENHAEAKARLSARGFVFPPYFHSMAEELAAERVPLDYTIDGLHPRGGNTLFVAQFKAGKTTLELNIAKALCDEVPLFGRIAVRPTAGKRVAFWNYELPWNMFDEWLDAMEFEHPLRIKALHLRGHRVPFLDHHVQNEIIAYLQEENIGFWFLDGASKIMSHSGIESENDNLGIDRILDAIDYMKAEAGVEDVIVAGHWGRARMEEGEEHIRVATRWDDWADARWSLTRDGDGTRSFQALDVRGAEPEPAFTLSFDNDTKALMAAGYTRDEHRKRTGAAEVCMALDGNGGPLNATELDRAMGGDKNLKPKKRGWAEELGWIKVEKGGSGRETIHSLVPGKRKEWAG